MRKNEGRLSPFEFDNPKDAENSPFEASSVLIVKATGLTAGTKYTYHIGKADTDEWYGPFEFTTKPEKVDSFSFVGVADPQMYSEKDVECFKKDISTAIADVPETAFIVSLGDLAGLGYNESLWDMHFESLKGYGESIPYMGVVGNHDVESPVAEFDEQWNQMENCAFTCRFLQG